MKHPKDRGLTIRFEQDLFDQLARCAEAEDRSVASLIRHLARRYVECAEQNRPRTWNDVDRRGRGSPHDTGEPDHSPAT